MSDINLRLFVVEIKEAGEVVTVFVEATSAGEAINELDPYPTSDILMCVKFVSMVSEIIKTRSKIND